MIYMEVRDQILRDNMLRRFKNILTDTNSVTVDYNIETSIPVAFQYNFFNIMVSDICCQ